MALETISFSTEEGQGLPSGSLLCLGPGHSLAEAGGWSQPAPEEANWQSLAQGQRDMNLVLALVTGMFLPGGLFLVR